MRLNHRGSFCKLRYFWSLYTIFFNSGDHDDVDDDEDGDSDDHDCDDDYREHETLLFLIPGRKVVEEV